MLKSSAVEWLPSILAADPLDLRNAVEKVVLSGIKQIHLDIMDGHFVPNISFGPQIAENVHKTYPALFLDVHLMLARPDAFIDQFLEAGAGRMTLHAELSKRIVTRSLKRLRDATCLTGLAINPETSMDVLCPYLEEGSIDRILIMSVHPGFSGQTFIASVLPKVEMLKMRYPDITLCMDGGINSKTAAQGFSCGARAFVMGASFFQVQPVKKPYA
ncbi:MAG: ribulose-phosphate 3-epimerase [Puniceicoccales bacterium]|jgi:ribulose-phosphate 3-epimerase|nr:ribulose-phosphate 3-epimerase [Puniceicoccales bacterium]